MTEEMGPVCRHHPNAGRKRQPSPELGLQRATVLDNGGKLRALPVLDEYSRECLVLHVARTPTSP